MGGDGILFSRKLLLPNGQPTPAYERCLSVCRWWVGVLPAIAPRKVASEGVTV